MDKQLLRTNIRSRLKGLSSADKALQSSKIAQLVKSLDLPDGSVCIYNALPDEVDTKELIDYFMQKREVYLPVVEGDDILLVKIDKNTQYEIAKWNISQPLGERILPEIVNPAITITPLLGADKQLNRLGKGKGFYDRYFDKTNSLRIGLAFEEQLVNSVPCDKWDKKLHMLVCPNGVIK